MIQIKKSKTPRMIQTFWLDQNNQKKPNSVPRGDGYGSRGSNKEEEIGGGRRRAKRCVRCCDRRRDWLGEWNVVKVMYIVNPLTDEYLAFLSCLHNLLKANSTSIFGIFRVFFRLFLVRREAALAADLITAWKSSQGGCASSRLFHGHVY